MQSSSKQANMRKEQKPFPQSNVPKTSISKKSRFLALSLVTGVPMLLGNFAANDTQNKLLGQVGGKDVVLLRSCHIRRFMAPNIVSIP
jgi:hypothetical protein